MNTQVILSVMRRATKRATLPGLQFVNVTDVLTRFRVLCESEAEQPAHQISVNLAEVLSDIACFLELGTAQHDAILGADNVQYLETLLSTPIKPMVKQ